MTTARNTPYPVAAFLVTVLASTAGAVDWAECSSADRTALLAEALLWEVRAEIRNANAPVACVVVGIAEYEMEGAVDPPAEVTASVARAAECRIVAVSRASDCPGAPRTFVGEPRCAGPRGIVPTKINNHCPLEFHRTGKRWVDVTSDVCA